MNANAGATTGAVATVLIKADGNSPALAVLGRDQIAVKAGTIFNGRNFADLTPIAAPAGGFVAGADYGVIVGEQSVEAARLTELPTSDFVLGGFHFAPGGNAPARAGGDDVPQINSYSMWDCNFRPACPDPRGMALIDVPGGRFWCDIYLAAADHLAGTSRFDVPIADGESPPQKPDGKRFKRFDYETAIAVMTHHGKGLLGPDEFFAAAFGVTELTAHSGDPRITQLDAPRTSKFGLMQATGNLWAWGHDGDPESPRASFFGGAWWYGEFAGSRFAALGRWPDYSYGNVGARGRCDHLQLG